MPKSNSQQKSTPDARIRHQPWGQNGAERAALLGVRTGAGCPEGNRRELLWDTSLNCGTAKEREKINLPEHTAGCSQNKGSDQVEAARLEAGGRGKGQARPEDRSPYRTADGPPVSNQRPPEILDGRHAPGGSRRDTGRRHPAGAGGN